MDKLLISPAPHLHSKDSTRRIMRDVIIALMPAVLVSVYFAGLSALLVIVVSVTGCVLVEHLIVRYLMKKKSTVHDLSAVVTGLILALNLPVSSPWWMVLTGCVAAIGIAKMTFGGLGHNPSVLPWWHVSSLISFPVQMTNWSVSNSIFRPDLWELPKDCWGRRDNCWMQPREPLPWDHQGRTGQRSYYGDVESAARSFLLAYAFRHIDGSLGKPHWLSCWALPTRC